MLKPQPTFVFQFDTKGFLSARLEDGILTLEMPVNPEPMFRDGFVDGLRGDIGEDADYLLDRMTYEMNRQIAVRLLANK